MTTPSDKTPVAPVVPTPDVQPGFRNPETQHPEVPYSSITDPGLDTGSGLFTPGRQREAEAIASRPPTGMYRAPVPDSVDLVGSPAAALPVLSAGDIATLRAKFVAAGPSAAYWVGICDRATAGDQGAIDALRKLKPAGALYAPVHGPHERNILHQVDGRTTVLSTELGYDASTLEQLAAQMGLDQRDNRIATTAQLTVMLALVARLRAYAAQLVNICANLDVPLPNPPTLPPAPRVPPART